ncbi:MAG: hypothetical protein QNK04_17960 [Myxococcota bacterium]|nr:hypothetical protein [Myxococcota bacterium]
MPRYSFRFVLSQPPRNEDEATRLSQSMSREHGFEGGQLAAVTPIGNDTILLVFQFEDD